MAQEIFYGLKNHQKKGIKHISFTQNNGQSSLFNLSDDVLYIYSNNEQPKGGLDLEPFLNLRKITFQNNNIQLNSLENIDISKNEKLNKIVLEERSNTQRNNFFHNNNFILLMKEIQSKRIILSYYCVRNNGSWAEKYKYLREQAILPYLLIEDRKLEQSAAEIAELKQSLNQKDQTIADFNKKIQQTPTLDQFRELNNIVLGRTELNFNNLKQEIKRLKLKDFNPYFQEQKNTFEQLTATAKNKAGDSLRSILDLFLQTNKQIIESENESNNSFARGQLQGQLTTCQTLLQTKFTQEELRSLLNKQKELSKLEKHSVILQQ
ncbi:8549_t:CDS:1 [Racocetra fulgida]|uniref:8549_t:CDS:1 n=1 Tax=Racocetra fulgida TaxID=60492 RepID=A0A9N9NUL3_9GLOM|nr:8549_t:CDS:1 [Racocetra fulgida]